jgi:hypothetical protein
MRFRCAFDALSMRFRCAFDAPPSVGLDTSPLGRLVPIELGSDETPAAEPKRPLLD